MANPLKARVETETLRAIGGGNVASYRTSPLKRNVIHAMPETRSFACRTSLLLTVLLGVPLQELAAQNLELGSPIGTGARAGQSPVAPPRGVAPSQIGRNGTAEFFVVGRLERVRKGESGVTRYALMDESGRVTAFVAPTAKYKLKQWIGREVGITAKSFTQGDDAPPFVLVDQLTPLDADDWQVTAAAPAEIRMPTATPQPQVPAAGPLPTSSRVAPATYQQGPTLAAGQSLVPEPHVEEALPPGAIVVDDGWSSADVPAGHGFHAGDVLHDSCSSGTCGSCSSCSGGEFGHGVSCQIPNCMVCRRQPAACGPPGWLWLRGEYLLWWAKGMETPPLVTTSPAGTPASQAGVLPDAQVLYGDEDLLTDGSSGFRIRFGGFFGPRRHWGYEAEYLSLSGNTETFTASSDGNGNPILARPFFNINPLDNNNDPDPPPANDAQLVAYPGLLAGTITVTSTSDFQSAAGRLKFNLCCNCGSVCGNGCTSCGYPRSSRLDLLLGYRHYGLDESLTIREDLTSIDATNPGTFDIRDTFETRNDFHGGEIWPHVGGYAQPLDAGVLDERRHRRNSTRGQHFR